MRPAEDVYYRGKVWTVLCASCSTPAQAARAFLNGISKDDRADFQALIVQFADSGRIWNELKFKKVEGSDGIFEFKIRQARLFCFMAPGRRLVLTSGLVEKKRDKLPKEAIERAARIKKEHVQIHKGDQ